MARQDVDAVRDIIKKSPLTREDLAEALNLLSSVESKLCNYSVYERYIILKFFIWIREFVQIRESMYDYRNTLAIKARQCFKCKGYADATIKENLTKCECEKPDKQFKISDRFNKILLNIEMKQEHNVKFLIDLYLNISRTSLSLNAKGFEELLKSKFEIAYPGQGGTTTEISQPQTSIFGGKK
jgi:hypothetical protein